MELMIVEDDDLHRSFMRRVVEDALPEYETISEACDGDLALERYETHEPNAIIIDLQMPNLNGVETARRIWHRDSSVRILFWSNYSDEAYIRGVSKIVPEMASYGYLLKSASEERLRLALRAVFIEEQCVIDKEVRGVQHRATHSVESLTEVEYQVLADLALGLTDRTIAERRKISTRGVQARLQQLYAKLGIDAASDPDPAISISFNSRTRAVFLAFSRGLLNTEALAKANTELEAWAADRK
ncbi:response regulator transcription factor [Falsihalocynthiibacter arcticus]|jgi:DNA-binding NarL/FixJ family response regulator|uniref:response regulator transcription factor n=1 Tax=Falsihalocynthiibacter arcticus TaxID=1579316 RepID=UPI0030038664